MTIRVLDPRQPPEGDALRLAPALPSLAGAVIGFIDNAKIGTERFYGNAAEAQAGLLPTKEVACARFLS